MNTTDNQNPIEKASEIAFGLLEEMSLFQALFTQSGHEMTLGQAELAGFSRLFAGWVHSACELTEAIGEISQSDSMTGASIDALHHGEVSQ